MLYAVRLTLVAAAALLLPAVASAQAGTPATTVDITDVDRILVERDAVLFGRVFYPDTFAVRIRYTRATGEWRTVDERIIRRSSSAEVDPDSGAVVAPGWRLIDVRTEDRGPAPFLRADRDRTRYAVQVTLSPAARAEVARLTGGNPNDLPAFSRTIRETAHAANYIWLGLGAGVLSPTSGEECEPQEPGCVEYAGGVVQFNTKT